MDDPATDRSMLRRELVRLMALAGLSGVAIAQPILDVFGTSPESFLVRNVTGAWIYVFAVVVGFGPPLMLWFATFGAGTSHHRRETATGVVLAAVSGLVGLVVSARLGAAPPATVALGALAAGAVWWRRASPQLNRFLVLLGIIPVAACLLFIFGSESGDLRSGVSLNPIEVAVADPAMASSPLPSVIWIMLDELPTRSIVDLDGNVDEVRFPSLATFAAESTWYRNTTTVSGWTRSAVPSILTGRFPTNTSPVASAHPNNIFRLLAGSHHLSVSESLTDICACGQPSVAPEPDATRDASPAPTNHEPDADVRGLLADTVDAWRNLVSGNDDAIVFDDFVEEAVPVSETEPPQLEELPSVSLAPGLDDERQDRVQAVAQPQRFRDFVAALQPTEMPTFSFLHLVLPHHPWQFWPDGSSYPEADPQSTVDDILFETTWDANLNRQRHLLQATYADTLLGEALDAARRLPNYDESMVIVSSDHGVSFELGRVARVLDEQNAGEIMWAPLLIKYPGQRAASIDDSNVLTIDIVPTIVDTLGLVAPWAFDGVPIGSSAQQDRSSLKPYYRFRSFTVQMPDATLSIDSKDYLADVLSATFPPMVAEVDWLTGLVATIPEAPLLRSEFVPDSESSARLNLDSVDAGSTILTGTAPLAVDDQVLLLAADDRGIVAVSPLFPRESSAGFAFLLPQNTMVGTLRFAMLDLPTGEVTEFGRSD